MRQSKRFFLLPVLLLLGACDQGKTQPVTVTRERSQAVLGAAPAATTASPLTATAAVPAAPKTPRRLCGGQLSTKGVEVSTEPLSRRAASAERDLPESLRFTRGFTWVNFWAAWCVPCKEEIPILVDWEKKLVAAGVEFRLAFVSLDDDERQLMTFLEQQPSAGLRRSYWLKEGNPRLDWLGKVGMKPEMQLPAHLIVDSTGKVACKIQGAIESSDYPQILGLLHGAK